VATVRRSLRSAKTTCGQWALSLYLQPYAALMRTRDECLRIGEMCPKSQGPPICIGGSERLCAADVPRYMNVPSPAPCHVNVAGVGKQSVWGLRIIARSKL